MMQTLAEYGGSLPQSVSSPSVGQGVSNIAIAMPVPKPEWEPHPAFCTASLQEWPANPEMLDKTGLPFSVTFHPMAETGGEVPVVNFGDCHIIRCKRCRTYINPYVVFIDGGKRWKCNICYFYNDGRCRSFLLRTSDSRLIGLMHSTTRVLLYRGP